MSSFFYDLKQLTVECFTCTARTCYKLIGQRFLCRQKKNSVSIPTSMTHMSQVNKSQEQNSWVKIRGQLTVWRRTSVGLSTMRFHHRRQRQLDLDHRRQWRVPITSGSGEFRSPAAAASSDVKPYFCCRKPYVWSLCCTMSIKPGWVMPSQCFREPSWSHPATSSSTADKYVTWRDLDRMRTKVSSSCIGLISLLVLGLICTHLHSCCTTDAIYSKYILFYYHHESVLFI